MCDDGILCGSPAMFLLCSRHVDPDGTDRLFTQAIACAERAGDHFLVAVLRNNAGVHALQGDNVVAARSHLEQAAIAQRAIGADIRNIGINMGWVLHAEANDEAAKPMFEAGLRMSRRNGDRPGLAYSTLGLACLAAEAGDWRRAAVLHGAAQAFLDLTGEQWVEPERRYRDDSLEECRARLGDDDFPRAYAEGTGLGIDGVMTVALPSSPARPSGNDHPS
jgi:hypothetical protein